MSLLQVERKRGTPSSPRELRDPATSIRLALVAAPEVSVDVAVIGAGPTGLGAAWRLEELRAAGVDSGTSWMLIEAGAGAGGLASSAVDEHGFRWDLGGHVLYSHYAYFDAVLEQVLAQDEWLQHERARWVRLRQRWAPYPIQRNLHRLAVDDLVRCVRGLIGARERAPAAPRNFAEWTRATFGDALDDLFFAPFNRKMWATEPEDMAIEWAGGRSGSRHANVPAIDLARLVENALRGRDDPGWNDDSRFPYPRHGGTGAIWERVLATLPGGRVRCGTSVESIDPERRLLRLSDGGTVHYGALVSGMPLDVLLAKLAGGERLADLARGLRHTSVHAIGLGFDGALPPDLERKLWIYFADQSAPHYRGTLLSTYSPENVPEPGRQWSILLEVATPPSEARDAVELTSACERSLRDDGIVPAATQTRARWHRFLPRGYPVPTLGRDAILGAIDSGLRAARIWSRGRFGGWKYEVSNQDHSFH